jgi:hypothetical protein
MVTHRKRTVLSLEDKDRVKVVPRHQKGETAIAIASSMSVGKTQVQQIVRDKETILKRWEEGESGSRNIGKVKVRKIGKVLKTEFTAIDDGVGVVS